MKCLLYLVQSSHGQTRQTINKTKHKLTFTQRRTHTYNTCMHTNTLTHAYNICRFFLRDAFVFSAIDNFRFLFKLNNNKAMLVLSGREWERGAKQGRWSATCKALLQCFLNVWWLQLREEKQNNNKGEGNGNVWWNSTLSPMPMGCTTALSLSLFALVTRS